MALATACIECRRVGQSVGQSVGQNEWDATSNIQHAHLRSTLKLSIAILGSGPYMRTHVIDMFRVVGTSVNIYIPALMQQAQVQCPG
eukprot:COSAG02_NODE_23_length_52893_cov_58.101868_45_plen_87_part_00